MMLLLAAVAAAVVVGEAEVRVIEPGSHNGGGKTTAYRYSDLAPGRTMEFRKRVLHAGSSIGVHPIAHDEVYYIVSGTGELTAGGRTYPMTAGTAAYLYTGDTVGLRPVGGELTVIISYPVTPKP